MPSSAGEAEVLGQMAVASATPRPAEETASEGAIHMLTATQVCRSLQSGWNLASFNVQPISGTLPITRVQDVLWPIAGSYDAVLGFHDGQAVSYYPDLSPGFCDLVEMDPLHGYWIHMQEARDWCLEGEAMPADTPIELVANWDLVGYLPDGDRPVAEGWPASRASTRPCWVSTTAPPCPTIRDSLRI